MAEDPNIHPLWAAETKQIAATLDQLDYFQILGAETTASLDELKAQYHALQRNYHPDTFFQSPDTELRAAVMKISKRVAEAYVILRDADKRAKYLRDLAGPERAKKLRFTDQSEVEAKREKEEELGKTPQVRQLVTKAAQAAKAGDHASAARDLKTALLFEKNNELIKKRLEEVEAELKVKGPAKPAAPKPPGR